MTSGTTFGAWGTVNADRIDHRARLGRADRQILLSLAGRDVVEAGSVHL